MIRSLIGGALLVGGLAFFTPAMARNAASNAQILKIENDMAKARNADESVRDFDPQVLAYDMTGNSLKGRDTVRAAFAAGFAKIKDVKVEILTMSIESSSNIGFANSTQHVTANSATGGPPMDLVFRQTDCLRKVGGRWLVVSQHISVPFDPTNGRVVFNSH